MRRRLLTTFSGRELLTLATPSLLPVLLELPVRLPGSAEPNLQMEEDEEYLEEEGDVEEEKDVEDGEFLSLVTAGHSGCPE